MGLYKLCDHRKRDRDRCDHPWWGSFRGTRVSLTRWADRDVRTKAEAYEILDELKRAIRKGTFDPNGIEPPPPVSPMTFRQLAEVYVERHVKAKQLSKAGSMTWRLRPLMERFGDRPIAEIKTADVEDWIADLRKPRMRFGREHVLAAASVNRSIEILRHMLNWAIGREYLDKTPFRRGTETLIRKLRENNMRCRQIWEHEHMRFVAHAPAHPGP